MICRLYYRPAGCDLAAHGL